MSGSRSLLLALLIVALAAGLWLALRGNGGAARREPAGASAREVPADAARPAPAPLEEARVLAPEVRGTGRSAAAPATGPAAEQSFAPDGGATLEVVVAHPPGSPPDETLAVLALFQRTEERVPAGRLARALAGSDVRGIVEKLRAGGESEQAHWAWSRIGTEPSAELPVPPGAAHAVLVLDGAFLFLDGGGIELDPRAERRVVLEPELGARLSGSYVLPPGAGAFGVERGSATGRVSIQGGAFLAERPRFRSSIVSFDADGRYELRALYPDVEFELEAAVDGLGRRREPGLVLAPGEDRVLDLAVPLGGRVRGTVRGDDGTPVAGASLALDPEVYRSGLAPTRTTSGADGTYLLSGLAPGESRVLARANGWTPGRSEPFVVRDGQELAGVDVVLPRGGHVAGTVTWPDGAPAAGAEVVARAAGRYGEETTTWTGEDGTFRATGLAEGSFRIEARATRPAEGGAPSRVWRARADGVAAGESDLALVLERPLALAGFVRDEGGAPVRAFELFVTPARDWAEEFSAARGFESDDGSFLVDDLFAGEWELRAQAPGHADMEEPLAVTLPHAGEPVVLVLSSASRISGRVLDPIGNPVPGAAVAPEETGGGMSFVFFAASEHESDRQGRFTIEDLSPGTHGLRAMAEGWAASETVAVEVAAGEHVEGVELRLRAGGRIVGEVVDEAGEPLSGVEVTLGEIFTPFGWSERTETTDGTGSFVFERVTPGEWVVTAGPDRAEIEALDSEEEMIALVSQMISAEVVVADGEDVRVRLSYRTKRPVRVYGDVRSGSEPWSGRRLYAIAEGGSLLEGMRIATTDAAGRYEVLLDRPGRYVFALGTDEDDGPPSLEFPVDVPDADEHRADLRVPAGRIEGTVYDAAGARLPEVVVTLSRTGAGPALADMAGGLTATTDEAGRYAFEHLWPGVYTARAGGLGLFVFGASGPVPGIVVQGGLRVEDGATLSGVDFRLGPAGRLTGIVRGASGKPASGVSIFVRDASGELVSSVSRATSDAGGRFTYEHLAPGTVVVAARGAGVAARSEPVVQVRAGEATEVELVVLPGATLSIATVDGSGAPFPAGISVRDARGYEVSGMLTESFQTSAFNEGLSSSSRRVGPLPPGGYEVVATARDGRRAGRTVALEAGAERELVLVLGD